VVGAMASSRMEKCSVLAAVSWPAKRKMKALPVISGRVRWAIFLAGAREKVGEVVREEMRAAGVIRGGEGEKEGQTNRGGPL